MIVAAGGAHAYYIGCVIYSCTTRSLTEVNSYDGRARWLTASPWDLTRWDSLLRGHVSILVESLLSVRSDDDSAQKQSVDRLYGQKEAPRLLRRHNVTSQYKQL